MFLKNKLILIISAVIIIILSIVLIYFQQDSKSDLEVEQNHEYSRYTQSQVINIYFNNIVKEDEKILKSISTNEYYLSEHLAVSEIFQGAIIADILIKKDENDDNYNAEVYILKDDSIYLIVSQIELISDDNCWKISKINHFTESIEVYAKLTEENVDIIDVPKRIYEVYLEKYLESDDSNTKITDYEIVEVELLNSKKNRIEFSIIYNVKPYSDSSIFLNFGPLNNKGYVEDITKFVDVIIFESNFYMISDATGL